MLWQAALFVWKDQRDSRLRLQTDPAKNKELWRAYNNANFLLVNIMKLRGEQQDKAEKSAHCMQMNLLFFFFPYSSD